MFSLLFLSGFFLVVGCKDNVTNNYYYYYNDSTLFRDTLIRHDTVIVHDSAAAKEYALLFNGINQKATVPTSAGLFLSKGSFTLEALVTVNNKGYFQWVFDKSTTGPDVDYLFGLTREQNLRLATGAGAATTITDMTTTFDPSKIYHIAAVADVIAGTATIYVNGIQTVQGSLSNSPNDVSSDLNIGARNTGILPNENWNGTVDELRIWNIARSQSDIQRDMNRSLSGTEQGLVAYWPVSEGSGSTLGDKSGHGHDGVLIGNPTWIKR